MKISFLFFLFMLTFRVAAQAILSGRVVEQGTGEPLIGAAVYIVEKRSGASTDAEGRFRLVLPAAGQYTVQVSALSLRTLTEKIEITGEVVKNFSLSGEAVSLEEVIVSGASTKTIVKESPIPIATLSQKQWLQGSSTNLVDAVAKLPGVSQVTTGAGISKPVIRGLGFNRVITLHDGIRQEDNQWGEEHGIHVDEYSIDRYEIIRGAGSLIYGSDGLGGVLSVLSPLPPPVGKIGGSVMTNYQSVNHLYGISAMVNGNRKGFNWLFRASRKSAGNYRNAYDGPVYGSTFQESLNLNGNIGLTRKWGYSRLYFAHWQQQVSLIEGMRDSLGRFTRSLVVGEQVKRIPVTDGELRSREIASGSYQHLQNVKISTNNLFFVGKATLTFNYGYSRNRRQEYDKVLTPGQPSLYFYLQTHYYDLRYTLPERNNWETTIGTNGMYQRLINRGQESLYPDYRLFDNGIFVFVKKSFEKLKISAGLRHDVRNLRIQKLYVDSVGRFQGSAEGAIEERFAGYERTFSNFTGSLGAVYAFNPRLLLRFNIGRGFRSPSVPEISSNGEHAGTFRYEIGNRAQASEVSLQEDLGLTWEGKKYYLDVSIFENSIAHYSYSERLQARNGQDSLIAGAGVYRYVQGNARIRGAEGQFTLNPVSWLSLTQSYSLALGSNLSVANDSARYLPFMPPPRWLSRLRFSANKATSWLRNVYFLIEIEHHQAQHRYLAAYHTETATPDYTLLNAGMGGDIKQQNGKTLFSIYLTAQNLTDRAYQNHQSRLKNIPDLNPLTGRQGVFNPGRNIGLRIIIPFELGQ